MSESETETTGTATRRRTERQSAIMWLSGIVSLFGAWLLLTATLTTLDVFVATYELGPPSDAALWNNALVGAAIFLVSGYNFYRIYTDHSSSLGAVGLVLLLGLWMVVFPFVVEVTDAALWNDVIAGGAVALISIYTTYSTQQRRTRATQQA